MQQEEKIIVKAEFRNWSMLVLTFLFLSSIVGVTTAPARDLADILDQGELHHIGVPYAKFVTGSGDGFSCDLIQLFARNLGVKYVPVKSSWNTVISDLTGKTFKVIGNEVKITGETPIKGDLIANGLTILPWRKNLIDYSEPTFPSGVWLIAAADSSIQPIKPSGNLHSDIKQVKSLLINRTLLCMPGTCLDSELYNLTNFGAIPVPLNLKMNEFAPAVLNGKAETSLLDVADSLIALEKWPGKVKVIGPISTPQEMAVGFPKSSPHLLRAFNTFLNRIIQDGTYLKMVKKYYPDAQVYFPDFFIKKQ